MSKRAPPPKKPKPALSMGQQANRGKAKRANPLNPVDHFHLQKAYEKALTRHLQHSPTVAVLYEPYKTMSGFYELPYVSGENQLDAQRNGIASTLLEYLGTVLI